MQKLSGGHGARMPQLAQAGKVQRGAGGDKVVPHKSSHSKAQGKEAKRLLGDFEAARALAPVGVDLMSLHEPPARGGDRTQASASTWLPSRQTCLMTLGIISVACAGAGAIAAFRHSGTSARRSMQGGVWRRGDGPPPFVSGGDYRPRPALADPSSVAPAAAPSTFAPVGDTLGNITAWPGNATSTAAANVTATSLGTPVGNVTAWPGNATSALDGRAWRFDDIFPPNSTLPLADDWAVDDLWTFLTASGGGFESFVERWGGGFKLGETRESYLQALYTCLQPKDEASGSPWAAESFNATRYDAVLGRNVTAYDEFLLRAGLSMGQGLAATAQDDPAFRHSTFSRIVHSLLFPSELTNSTALPASLWDDWLTWLRPSAQFEVCGVAREGCHGFGSPTQGESLRCQMAEHVGTPDVGAVRDRLCKRVFGVGIDELGPAKAWACRLLFARVDPILAMPAQASGVRIGSLPWLLQAIGLRMAGVDGWQLPMPAHIALATTTYLTALDHDSQYPAAHGAVEAFYHAFDDLIALYAHAAGVIDLRQVDGHDGAPLMASALYLQIVDHFNNEMRETYAKVPEHWFESVTHALPHRATLLRDSFIRATQQPAAPDLSAFLPAHMRDLADRTPTNVMGAIQLPVRADCYVPGRENWLFDSILSDCMADIRARDATVADWLVAKGLDSTSIDRQFKLAFDAKIAQLRDETLRPALIGLMGTLPTRDATLWHCGEWEILVPSITVTRRPDILPCTVMISGECHDRNVPVEATHALFVKQSLAETTQHYVLTLDPLDIEPVDDMQLWLRKHPQHLFRKGDGTALDRLEGDAATFRSIRSPATSCDTSQAAGQSDTREALACALAGEVAQRLGVLWDGAYGKTTLAAHREAVREILRNFIPFHACMEDVKAGNIESAGATCALDVMAVMPVAAGILRTSLAGMNVASAMFTISTQEISTNLAARASAGGMLGAVPGVLDNVVLHEAVDAAVVEVRNTALATMRAIDPGLELGTRLMFGAPEYFRTLLGRLRGIPLFADLAGRWECATADGIAYVNDRAVWRVPAPHAEAFNALRVQHGLELAVWHGGEQVVVRRSDNGVRLANPVSKAAYGPWMATDAHGRLIRPTSSLAPVPRGEPIAMPPAGEPGACPPIAAPRARRAAASGNATKSAEPAPSTRSRRRPRAPHFDGVGRACLLVRDERPMATRPFDGAIPSWYRLNYIYGRLDPVPVNDVVTVFHRVAWPIAGHVDEYWLQGSAVMWRETTDGRMGDGVEIGQMPLDMHGWGQAYPQSGYVVMNWNVDLEDFAPSTNDGEPYSDLEMFRWMHASRRQELSARVVAQGGVVPTPVVELRAVLPFSSFAVAPEPHAEPLPAGAPYELNGPLGVREEHVGVFVVGRERFHFFRLGHVTGAASPASFGIVASEMRDGFPEAFVQFQAELRNAAQFMDTDQMWPSLRSRRPGGAFGQVRGPLEVTVGLAADHAMDNLRVAHEQLTLLTSARPRTAENPRVRAILECFVPGRSDDLAVAMLAQIEVVWEGIMNLDMRLPDVIGVFPSPAGSTWAAARTNFVQTPSQVRHVTAPVIAFDPLVLDLASRQTLSNILIHEASHLFGRTEDWRGLDPSSLYPVRRSGTRIRFENFREEAGRELFGAPPSSLRDRVNRFLYAVYIREFTLREGLRYDLRHLLGAERVEDVVRHAASFEHLVAMLAQEADPARRAGNDAVIHGGSQYSLASPRPSSYAPSTAYGTDPAEWPSSPDHSVDSRSGTDSRSAMDWSAGTSRSGDSRDGHAPQGGH